jgi:formylmethanofuran dehydrogenase subunit E
MSDEPEDMPDMDDIELPPMQIPKKDGPECPTCGESTINIDGEYICFDCNGGMYGPGMA